MPEIYNRLPPICERLGIPVPELDLQMSNIANSWTSGRKKVYIVLTLGLIRRVKGDALDAVLAHECGHILCQHVLYQTLANAIFSFGESFSDSLVGMVGNVAMKPIRQALIAWSRASELSADRVACAITSAEALAHALIKIDMIPKNIADTIDIKTWAQQGKDFEDMKKGSTWNKIVRWMANSDADHPFSPVRVYEAMNWEKSETCMKLKACDSCWNLEQKEQIVPSLTNTLIDKTESVAKNISSLTKGISLDSTLSKFGIHKK